MSGVSSGSLITAATTPQRVIRICDRHAWFRMEHEGHDLVDQNESLSLVPSSGKGKQTLKLNDKLHNGTYTVYSMDHFLQD
jgi:hypothetical protein